MKKSEFLLLLEEILEADPHTLTGAESLDGLEGWDSLGVVGFIALVDESFELTLSARKVNACKTVDELVSLIGVHITD